MITELKYDEEIKNYIDMGIERNILVFDGEAKEGVLSKNYYI